MVKIKNIISSKYQKMTALTLAMAMLLTTISVAFVPTVSKAEKKNNIGATGDVATQDWGRYTNNAVTATGSNTESNPNWEGKTEYDSKNEFYIRTAEDFNEFWYQATDGKKTFAGKTVYIANNITLTGGQNNANYKTGTVFQGTLDGDMGNGEMAIVTGMNRRTGDKAQGGVFNSSLNATIKNIVFKECDVYGWRGVSLLSQNSKDTVFENIHMWNCRVQNDDGGKYDVVGGFSAYAAGSTYRNCSYTGDKIQEMAKGDSSSFVYSGGRVVKSWSSEEEWHGIVGAFVGQAEKSTIGNPISIENCYVNSNIQSPLSDVGGFVGYATADCQGINISNSSMNGCVSATDYTRANIECFGGLVGRALCSVTVISSVNNAIVRGKKSVGGIIGYSGHDLSIKNTMNTKNILSSDQYAGGFAGFFSNTGVKIVENCVNKGSVHSDSTGTGVGGIVGASQNSTIKNSINIGEVKGTNYFGGIYGSILNDTSVNVDNCLSIGNIALSSGYGNNYGGIAGEYKGGVFKNNYYVNVGNNVAVGGENDNQVGSQNLIQDVTLGLGRYNNPLAHVEQIFMDNLGIVSMNVDSLSSANADIVGVKGGKIRGFKIGSCSVSGTLAIKGRELSTIGFAGDESDICSVSYSATATVDNSEMGTQDWTVESQSKMTGTPGQEYTVQFTVKTANVFDLPTGTPSVSVTGPKLFSEAVTVTRNGNTYTGGIVFPEEGNYTLVYSYPETLDDAVTQSVDVVSGKKATTSNIVVSPSVSVVGSEVTITATVDGVNGIVDFGNSAEMKINGTECEIGSDGVAKFIPQTTGENVVEFNFIENADYYGSSAKGSFSVGKETPSMTFSDQPSVKYDGEQYSESVLDGVTEHNFTEETSNIVYTYYIDGNCQTKTSAENSGAKSEGSAPAFAGNYWIQALCEENEFYNKVSLTKHFRIDTAKVTANVLTNGKIYDGTDRATGTVSAVGAVGSDQVVLTVKDFKFDSANAGERTATGTIEFADGQEKNKRNYEIDQNNSAFLKAIIAQKSVTISVTAKDKIYDGTNVADFDSVSIEGMVANDENDVTVKVGSLSFEDGDVGTDKLVSLNNPTLEGAKALNYVINTTSIVTDAKITPKFLTIIINPLTIFTGQYADGFNFDKFKDEVQVSGLANGETIESLGVAFEAPILTVDSSVNGKVAFEQKSVVAKNSVKENGNYIYPAAVSFMLTCESVEAVEGVDYTITTEDGSPFTEDGWTGQAVTVVSMGGTSKFDSVSKTADISTGTQSITFDETTQKEDARFYLINSVDGTVSKVVMAFAIDMQAPENITLSVVGGSVLKKLVNSVSFGLFFSDSADFEVAAEDSHSGIAGYKVTGENNALTGGNITKNLAPGEILTVNSQFVGNLKIQAFDKVGNISSETFETFAVDTNSPTAPDVIEFANGYKDGTWSGENVQITVSGATADSGIKEYQYSVDNGVQWLPMTENVQLNPSTGTAPQTVSSASVTVEKDGVTEIVFRAVSNSGIPSTKSDKSTVKIDRVTPSINVDSDYNFGSWTNDDVEIIVTNKAKNQSNVSFKYSTDGTVWTDMDNGKIKLGTDVNTVYKFKAISQAGVADVSGELIVKIQKTLPSNVNFEIAPLAPNGENGWYNTRPECLINGEANSESSAPISSVSYKLFSGTSESNDFTKVSGVSATPTVTKDGMISLTYYVTDEAGNTSPETTKSFKVDTTAPTAEIVVKSSVFKEFVSSITFGLFFKDHAQITIDSKDEISGVSSVEYQKVSKGEQFSIGGRWETYTSPVKVLANEKFSVYAKVTDESGLVSIVNSDGIVVYTDSVLKTVETQFCPDKNETRGGYEDVVVEMNLNGNTLKEITLDGKALVRGKDYLLSENSVIFLKEYLANVVSERTQFTFVFNPMGEIYVSGGINETPIEGVFDIVELTHVGVPEIVTNLENRSVYSKGENAKELAVEATTTNGELTYQWFVNGKTIDGATSATCVPETQSNGVFQYFVQVTCTNRNANGEQVSVVKSDTSTIIVKNSQVVIPENSGNVAEITVLTDADAILHDNLTGTDKSNLEKGYDIKLLIEIMGESDIQASDKSQLKNLVNSNVIDVFGLSLTKVTLDTNGIETVENLNTLVNDVQFSLQIPKECITDRRVFSISRITDGKIEGLVDIGSEPGNYTFETDKSGSYALSYTDNENAKPMEPVKPSESTATPSETENPKVITTPATGDDSSNAPYYFLAVSAVVLLGVLILGIIRKKKLNKNQYEDRDK